jgi:hypothetical protein
LIRLIFAIVLALVDTLLSAAFLVGQLAFIVFGPTGRDVIYGLTVMIGVFLGRLPRQTS